MKTRYSIRDANNETEIRTRMDQVLEEVDIWRKINHASIAQLHEVLETDHRLYLLTDYCDSGQFMSWSGSGYTYNPKISIEATSLFRTIAEALTHLHDLGYAHGDIRPENLVFDGQTDRIMLIDFSNSKQLGSP